jgi:hypothetical protein
VENQKIAGKKDKGPNHPPKKKIESKALIKIIFKYSAKKNKAKVNDEYSTLYPETNSASASGKSKGGLLVSAKAEIKNIIKAGNKGIKNQTWPWLATISRKFKLLEQNKTPNKIRLNETSYEIIWAAERKAPNKAYFELLDHPAQIIPYTLKEEIANK